MRSVLMTCLLLSSSISFAQDGTWTTYASADGVRGLAVSSDTLWAATNGGLVGLASDGGVIRLDNLDGLGGIDLHSLAIGPDGVVWTGTDNGWLSEYVPDSGRTAKYRFREETLDLTLSDLFADDVALWVATDIGLAVFPFADRERRETYVHLGELPDEAAMHAWAPSDYIAYNLQNPASWRTTLGYELPSDTVTALAVLGDTLFAGTKAGVARAVPGTDTTWTTDGLNTYVRNISVIDGALTAVSTNGVWRRGPTGGWSEIMLPDSLQAYASCAAAYGTDTWFGTTSKGFVYGDESHWSLLRLSGPSGSTFTGFSPDATGGVWIATAAPANQNNGVVQFVDGTWINHRPSSFTGDGRHDVVRDVLVAADGRVWAMTYGGGAVYYDGESWIEADPDHLVFDEHTADYVPLTDVSQDEDGTLWIVSYSVGAYAASPDLTSHARYYVGTGLVTDNVYAAAIDSSGHLWAGTRREGVDVVDIGGTPFDTSDDDVENYTKANDNLSDDSVNEIVVDVEGNVWLGTDAGLTKYDAQFGTFFPLAMPDDLDLQIRAIAVDSRGIKWVGTADGLGALSADESAWQVYRTDNSGLVDDGVFALWFDDDEGDLWIGTEGGISVLSLGSGGMQDYSDLAPYPNPCVVERDGERVAFDEVGLLPADSRVDIVTIRGELVRTLDVVGNFANPVVWDLRNRDGEKVAGGMYIFVVTSADGEKLASGKIAVIR
jgi:streptogramin lyase